MAVTERALLRDISATLETVIGRLDQLEDAEEDSSGPLPEETINAIDAIRDAARHLRRYR